MEEGAIVKKVRKKKVKKPSDAPVVTSASADADGVAVAAVAAAAAAPAPKKRLKKRRPKPVEGDSSAAADTAASDGSACVKKKKSRRKKVAVAEGETSDTKKTTKKKKKRPTAKEGSEKDEELERMVQEAEKRAEEKKKAEEEERKKQEQEAAAKPVSAGLSFQQKIWAEQEAQKKKREEERKMEIEKARGAFLDHAKEVALTAVEKEKAELAEKERLRKIEEHMNEMRGEKGDAVRASVVSKLKDQTATSSLEPIKQKDSAGAKWAAKQQQEVEERNRRREEERAQEIAEAKDNYFNSLIESKMSAAEKESMWLAEKKRLEDIDKHRTQLSKERGYEKKTTDESLEKPKKSEGGGIPETNGRVLTYEEIRNNKSFYQFSDEYSIKHLEAYLTDSEFERVFEMSKADFYDLPKWKRGEILKKVELF